jgi:hypothetical protein
MQAPETRGLCLSEIRVNDAGMVQFQRAGGWGDITSVSVVTDVYGETYTDENGIEINVRQMLNNFVLAEPQYDNVRAAESYSTEYTDTVFDTRTKVFLQYFENYLEGVVDPARRFNKQ